MSLCLVLPASASAKEVLAPKVLVVTSTDDALSTAGKAAITAAAAGGAFEVNAPAPANVAAEFANLDSYQAVVFLNTGLASPLTDANRTAFETYFRKGGGFVGVGSAIESDPNWAFLTSILGTRSSGRTVQQTGTVKVFDRVHDATKGLPLYWERDDNFYNLATNVRGSRTSWPRWSRIRSARSRPATRSTASPAAPTAPTIPCPSARTTRAAARSTPGWATRPARSTRL